MEKILGITVILCLAMSTTVLVARNNSDVAETYKILEIDIYKKDRFSCQRNFYEMVNYRMLPSSKWLKKRNPRAVRKDQISSQHCDHLKPGESQCLLYVQKLVDNSYGNPTLFGEGCYEIGESCDPGPKIIQVNRYKLLSYKTCN